MDEEKLLASLEKRLAKHCLSAIEIRPSKVKKPCAIGASKLNGRPDLPKDVGWPMWNKTHSYAFAGQIALAKVARYDIAKLLPTNGLLSFFVLDLRQAPVKGAPLDHALVIHTPKGTKLTRKEPPASLAVEHDMEELSVAFRKVQTWPQGEGALIAESPTLLARWKKEDTSTMKLNQEEWDLWAREAPPSPQDQMLGHPGSCEFPIGRDPNRRLLLSLGQVWPIGGRNGHVFFHAPLKAIRARKWDEVRMKQW